MSRNRKNATLNKKLKKREERLDSKTAFGISDPTPAAATNRIIRRENRQ